MFTRIRATKSLDVPRQEGTTSIDSAAESTRSRFATPGKHTIYDKKLQEAQKYLAAAVSGEAPSDLKKYPYMDHEVGPGKTAATPLALANLWISMNESWEQVSPLIEDISITAKARVRAAQSPDEIRQIVAEAEAALDLIGDKPPSRPPKKSNSRRAP